MPKLTPVEVKFWQKEAESCVKRQTRELIQKNNYPFLVLYYEGREKLDLLHPHIATKENLAIINEFFPNTNSLIADLMYQNPDIITEARKPEAEEGEDLMKAALKYGFDKTDALDENRLALFDMLYAGYSAVEVGHLIDKDEITEIPTEDQINERKGFFEKIKEKIGSEEDAEEKLEREAPKEAEAYATNENTFIRRWNPLNVSFDWRAERLKDMRYILKKIELSKAEFDAKYPDFKDKINVGDNRFEYSLHEDQKYTKKVVLYEFQIKKKQNEYWNLVICPDYAISEIDYFKRPYTTNGFDIKIGTLHKYGKLYPISMAMINKHLQDEMNEYVRFMKEVAERNVPKFITCGDVNIQAEAALRSAKINDIAKVEGKTALGKVVPLQPTGVSPENKELLMLFEKQKEKGWKVSAQRLGETGKAKFATELEIQEAGFQASYSDTQEGLRRLLQQELDTLKDIIVTFWDGAYFFKVTGGQKPWWYTPQIDPLTGMVLNPLTDILIGDYFINVDISTALRPNKERKKKELVDFATWITSPNVIGVLQMTGVPLTAVLDAIKKVAKEYGVPSDLFEPQQQAMPQLPTQEVVQ